MIKPVTPDDTHDTQKSIIMHYDINITIFINAVRSDYQKIKTIFFSQFALEPWQLYGLTNERNLQCVTINGNWKSVLSVKQIIQLSWRVTCFLQNTWSQPNASFETAPQDVSKGSVTHSEESPICPLRHTWAHGYWWNIWYCLW